MNYNFVVCSSKEYSIKNGVLKYTGTSDAIIIPDDVTEITNASVKNVKAIKLMQSTPAILTNKVEWFEVDDDNSRYVSIDGILFSKDKTKLIAYPILRKEDEYIVPDFVREIGENAFANAALKHITVNSTTISTIGEGAFRQTKKLSSFEWPESVTELKSFVFNKSGIKSVTLPRTINRIDIAAFGGCSSLANIEIPDSLQYISRNAFSGCESITKIELPDTIETIPSCCFDGCKNLCSIKLPAHINSICSYAFERCEKLTTISLPDGLKRIENNAFNNCKGLTAISLPDGLMIIGDWAFRSTGIASISVPSTVTETGTIFSDIKEVEYTGTMSEESQKKKAVADEKKKQLAEIYATINRIDEKIAEIKEDGAYIYQQNAIRLVKKRDENQAKLNALFAARNYPDYNALLLLTNEIPSKAICVYNCCGKNIKIYQRNKVDCTFAIENDGIVHLINVGSMGYRDKDHDFSIDASQLDKAIMTGIAGGSFLGYLATKTAQTYTVINAGVTIYNTKTNQDIVRIRFGDNYKVTTSQFNAIVPKIDEFNSALLKCVQDDVSPDEIATAGYIDSSIDEIRAKIESKKTRLAEKERKEKEDAKNRFDAYWAEHADEKEQLEAERRELNKQIEALQSNLNDQIASYNKDISDIPGTTEISDLDLRIKQLSDQKASLGIFKGKEKKALQNQIEQAFAEKTAIQSKMNSEKQLIGNKIASAKSEFDKKAESMRSRIQVINTELTKPR